MMRATYGVTAITRVRVGRISTTGCSHGLPPGGIWETAGRTWDTVVANRMTSAMPTTNSGSAAKTRVIREVATSKALSRQRAAYAPTRTDSGIEIRPEHRTRNAELTMRSAMSFMTGSWAAIDWPASPWSSPPAQMRYWMTIGRLRWSCSRSAARLAGVAVRPRIALAVSPGRAWVARKMMMETRIKTRAPSSSRLKTKAQIALRPTAGRGGACAAAPPGVVSSAVPLREPDGAEAMAERVQVQSSFAGHESIHFLAVGVDQVVEERNDVPALVVLELLHLMLERHALGLVDLAQCLLVEAHVVRAAGRPVALVVWGGGDAPVGHLR